MLEISILIISIICALSFIVDIIVGRYLRIKSDEKWQKMLNEVRESEKSLRKQLETQADVVTELNSVMAASAKRVMTAEEITRKTTEAFNAMKKERDELLEERSKYTQNNE